MTCLSFFCDVIPELAKKKPGTTTLLQRLSVRDQFIVLGAALAVAFLLVLLVIAIRKPGSDRARHPEPRRRPREEEDHSDLEPGEKVRRRRRRRKRDHRPRNATLNDTGGLPPPRPEDQPPPY